ncbi:hypothetical protein DY000_02051324 [Brassica cretica]|uniref:Uncharacterized protein n=1 Tax=Brassica cretica TaxID=69181 RepID=A0ABQ7F3U5_BRACR|nr:hypothetical protein DY000_02051324 [Brassica cretica]
MELIRLFKAMNQTVTVQIFRTVDRTATWKTRAELLIYDSSNSSSRNTIVVEELQRSMKAEHLPFNNFTRHRKSDEIIKDLTFNQAAYITAEWITRASAINTDETKLLETQMGSSVDRGLALEKIPPRPQFPL